MLSDLGFIDDGEAIPLWLGFKIQHNPLLLIKGEVHAKKYFENAKAEVKSNLK